MDTESSQITFSDQNIADLINGPNGGCPPIYDCDLNTAEVKKQEFAEPVSKPKGSVAISEIIRERKKVKPFLELSNDKTEEVDQEETDEQQ
jgi:hypothetical protein